MSLVWNLNSVSNLQKNSVKLPSRTVPFQTGNIYENSTWVFRSFCYFFFKISSQKFWKLRHITSRIHSNIIDVGLRLIRSGCHFKISKASRKCVRIWKMDFHYTNSKFAKFFRRFPSKRDQYWFSMKIL